jgi:hypothetical protein
MQDILTRRLVEPLERLDAKRRWRGRPIGAEVMAQIGVTADKRIDELRRGQPFDDFAGDKRFEAGLKKTERHGKGQRRRKQEDPDPPISFARAKKS